MMFNFLDYRIGDRDGHYVLFILLVIGISCKNLALMRDVCYLAYSLLC